MVRFADSLTPFGRAVLRDRYLHDGEDEEGMLDRLASICEGEHRERMRRYFSRLWFLPATPVMSNLRTGRGFPISCYLSHVEDSMESIAAVWNEIVWLGARGGGVGVGWSDLRPSGAAVAGRGGSSGIIPFVKVVDAITLAVSQGSLRRGAAACYLDVSHPEIEEFLEIRKPSGDFNRKSLNLHHGITVSDAFMEAVRAGDAWRLRAPHTGEVMKEVDARALWQAILETRVATGEPYLIFIDAVNRARPKHHESLELSVKQSNLCAEIVLPTGPDHRGGDRTAVCCLGSVNLEKYDEWKGEDRFVEDCLLYLDLVLSEFAREADGSPGFDRAVYSALRERSVGLGAMGFHSYLQSKMIPFESAMARALNKHFFNRLRSDAEAANRKFADELGPCPDYIDARTAAEAAHEENDPDECGMADLRPEIGEPRRFSYCLAVAPTASISIVAGGCSPCIEPWNSNLFIQKTLSGNFEVRNRYLERLLREKGRDTEDVWSRIVEDGGSVRGLDFLSDDEKAVFKTAFEIDQRWVVDLAGDRAPLIDQAQSVNVFLPADVDKAVLLDIHWRAWERGVKSLYYLRSKTLQRVASSSVDTTSERDAPKAVGTVHSSEDDGCLACQ